MIQIEFHYLFILGTLGILLVLPSFIPNILVYVCVLIVFLHKYIVAGDFIGFEDYIKCILPFCENYFW